MFYTITTRKLDQWLRQKFVCFCVSLHRQIVCFFRSQELGFMLSQHGRTNRGLWWSWGLVCHNCPGKRPCRPPHCRYKPLPAPSSSSPSHGLLCVVWETNNNTARSVTCPCSSGESVFGFVWKSYITRLTNLKLSFPLWFFDFLNGQLFLGPDKYWRKTWESFCSD